MDNIAYCGLNCDACSFKVSCEDKDSRHLQFLPKKYENCKSADVTAITPCPGCKHDRTCGDCPLKDCITAKNRSREVSLHNCSGCEEFPCALLLSFAHDGIPHHLDAVKNLESIRANGMQAFLERERSKWFCPKCRKKLSWYLAACPDCNEMAE